MVHGSPAAFHAPKPADQRDDIGVTELLERFGGKRGSRAAGAVEDDRRVPIANGILDPGLQESAGMAVAPGIDPLGDLVWLADVDGMGAGFDHRLGPGGIYLTDLGLDLRQQVSIGGRHLRVPLLPRVECDRRAVVQARYPA